MKPLLLTSLIALLACNLQAQQQQYANYGGLYFCPQTKDLIYVEWDANPDQHNAHALYWSATGQPPRRMQIATQYTLTKRQIQNDEYFIQLWEEVRPNVQYQCTFRASIGGGRPTLTMNLKDAPRRYEFINLGDEENGQMEEGNTQGESMVMTLSHLKFHVFNKDTKAYNFEQPVQVGLAEDPSILQIEVGTPAANTTFLAVFNNSLDMLAGVQTVDKSKNAYRIKFDIHQGNLLVMHLFGPDGKYFYSLAEHHSDFVGENTF